KVTKSNNWTVYEGIILFIDEASMIDRQLDAFIQEGTIKSKIVYVGDKNQLAPVKETLSPVYAKPNIPMYELLEPMRTSIPALQALNA
ncbi:AAA family ATPase, partial [Mycobacterium tuberculosis]|uniref:AAA family ATPase n=1 Tax=Mycobacterium tuberculosis TaxID=1773 RepID=UPI00254FD3E5